MGAFGLGSTLEDGTSRDLGMEGSRSSDQEPSKAASNPPGEAPPPRAGCGCTPSITISITPTTGGQFELHIARTETIESLKKLISKKLKVPKERICLLHRDRYTSPKLTTFRPNHISSDFRTISFYPYDHTSWFTNFITCLPKSIPT